ncbi:helix-turn-helix transcriptional regulator [Streptomyces sp. NPDC046931]|uniref:helix-turn-helix transcriptional regulator n=1 Tax=Streptomyces sp. NPDC046931 TaxID=3154806 RepID=UPI0033D51E47
MRLEVPIRRGPGSRHMATRPANPQEHARVRALAQRVRGLREERGWTRERLAKEAGVQPGTLARLESGERSSQVFSRSAGLQRPSRYLWMSCSGSRR